MPGKLVAVRSISPERGSDVVTVKRQGNFEQLLIVGIDRDFQFTGKLVERDKLKSGGRKFLRARMGEPEELREEAACVLPTARKSVRSWWKANTNNGLCMINLRLTSGVWQVLDASPLTWRPPERSGCAAASCTTPCGQREPRASI